MIDQGKRQRDAQEAGRVPSPAKLAHLVFRSSRFNEMIAWYEVVLGARTVFKNDILAFLTYDEEHHRVAILGISGLKDREQDSAGLHHAAFTYSSLGVLLSNYERLQRLGIDPTFVINHGPTTSIYYADPDNNQIELQVDNYDDVQGAADFFLSPAFASNPVGVEFDPKELLRRLRAGEPEHVLKMRPEVGAKGLDDIKI